MELTGVKLDVLKWDVVVLAGGSTLKGQVENGDVPRDFLSLCQQEKRRANKHQIPDLIISYIRMTDFGSPRN
jgi:hypothetical protein